MNGRKGCADGLLLISGNKIRRNADLLLRDHDDVDDEKKETFSWPHNSKCDHEYSCLLVWCTVVVNVNKILY